MMNDKEISNNAYDSLLDFFKKMYDWNIFASKYRKENGYNKEIKEYLFLKIKPTLEKYCTENLKKEFTGSCSELPDYDIEFLLLENKEQKRNKVIFFFKELNRSKNTYRYTLVLKDGIWLIDRKDWLNNGKWKKHYL